MDRDNTEIGKYRIVAQVGEGAMGVVYRALDPVLNRTVAIKVMSDAIARDDDLRGRFLREAQAAGSLQHPNVITIYDCGEVDGHLFIAMEFVEGEDLEEVLKRHAALSLVDKIDIIVDVLGGLSYAHKRGIVHRDIKPANIRIDQDGRARIMDFGIAHLSSSNMTRTGVMVGTPAYMAPEQIVGGAITPATDLFSVGAVLYELLTGTRPFNAETLQSVMYKIVSQPPPELPPDSDEIPPSMKDVLHTALAKEPGSRYASAVDMANALTAVRASLGRDSLARKSVSLRSVIDTALADERAAKTRVDSRRGIIIGGSISAGVAAVALAAMFWARGGGTKPPATPDTAVAPSSRAQAPSVTIDSAPARPVVQSSIPPASTSPAPQGPAEKPSPVTTNRSGNASANKSTSTPKPPPKSAPTSATAVAARAGAKQDLSLFQSLRATALENRKRAADAGASPDQLQNGDDQVKIADGLVSAGKTSDAAEHLSAATAAWAVAERDARAASAAIAAARQKSVPIETSRPQSVPQATPTAPAAAPPPAPTSNANADIRAAVAAYARAIESRDISEVRRTYPGITSAQEEGFAKFFASLQSMRASFTVSSIDVNGATAEAKLSGVYDYVTNTGANKRQPVTFQATLRRDGGVWTLASVR